ncbi:MBL fold metallo-hydrolase [Myxococcota bacterium]|nr:MBL fold metallo-hydrolase [Myxococcota bacterium]
MVLRLLAIGFVWVFSSFVLGPSGPAVAQGFDDVEIETLDLGHGVSMLTGQGGNIGVLAGPDGILMVDDQFEPLAPKIRRALQNLSDGPVRYLVNTHWHGDHSGGNAAFSRTGSVILAHEQVRARMSTEQYMGALDRRIPASPDAALPVITFPDEIRVHVNGEAVRILHVSPAHTDGDSIVLFPDANVLHMGDTYFNGMYPFFDGSSGGSVEGMLAALNLGISLADDRTRVIPGHGPISNRAELLRSRNMLAAVIERIGREKLKGASENEVLEGRPTADLDGAWGRGVLKPDDFVRLVYQSLPGPEPRAAN